jgi:hypothetical protein
MSHSLNLCHGNKKPTPFSQLVSMEEELKQTLADMLPPTNSIKQTRLCSSSVFLKIGNTRSDVVAHVKSNFQG